MLCSTPSRLSGRSVKGGGTTEDRKLHKAMANLVMNRKTEKTKASGDRKPQSRPLIGCTYFAVFFAIRNAALGPWSAPQSTNRKARKLFAGVAVLGFST